MKKKLLFIGIILVILVGIGLFFFLNQKNSWVCKDGEWIRKGSPKTSQPTAPCAGQNTKTKLPVVPPESTLVSFYTWLIKEDASALESYKTSPHLADAYKTTIETQIIAGKNPFLCSTETLEGITPIKTSLQGLKATIQFKQKFQSVKKSVIAQVQAEKDAWKITNITCND
jgi:hypothetical protein